MKKLSILFFIFMIGGMVYGKNVFKMDSTLAGEAIESVYLPKQGIDAFSVVQTDKGFYEIRLGGYVKLHCFEYGKYDEYESPKKGIVVKTVWTDTENIFLELMDSSYVGIGFLEMSGDGVMLEAVHYYDLENKSIREDFDFENDEEMIKLSTVD